MKTLQDKIQHLATCLSEEYEIELWNMNMVNSVSHHLNCSHRASR